ncbi:MAG: carbamoyltransferase C-terminal domain-containing protein, partial [Candidatus Margulisiibacteriota bacterium]
YYKKIKSLIKFQKDGKIELDLSYFSYYLHDQLHLYSDKFVKEFGAPRQKNDAYQEKHRQIAAALQKVVEEILAQCLNHLHDITKLDKVVVAGGVFMNSVFNGKILTKTKFKDVFITSSPDDSGTSIGAALHVYHEKAKHAKRFVMDENYFGPEFSDAEIKKALDNYRIKYQKMDKIEAYAAKKIAEGKLIGWFQGKMEFGQRSLGNRSILCDPRDGSMKDKVNLAVKYRESFRPFAPSVLEERAEEYFEIEKNMRVPFMEKVCMIRKEKQKVIPAVTHVDGSGRLQTVSKRTNPRYHRLISEFRKITGVPVLLNTSFNLNGEPIVCTPTDAIRTFYSCGLDMLVIGDYVVKK